eukprot:632728-Karenia_brevis.AAC.1
MATRKDHPVGGSPDKSKGKKSKLGMGEGDEEEMQLVEVEGMPPWAVVMQNTLMRHTSMKVDNLMSEVEEAKALAMEAQEDVRALRKEMQKMKEEQAERREAGNPQTMRGLKELEVEFEKLKETSAHA